MSASSDHRWPYLVVLDHVVDQIRRGELKPGQRLPSRAQMAQQYGVSETTIKRVVAILKASGFADGHQGKGMYVADHIPSGPPVNTDDG